MVQTLEAKFLMCNVYERSDSARSREMHPFLTYSAIVVTPVSYAVIT